MIVADGAETRRSGGVGVGVTTIDSLHHLRVPDDLTVAMLVIDEAHYAEYGYVTNQALRRLFDLGVYQARDLLRDLQERDVLRKIDEKSGGPGIRYGPGPSFPTRRSRRSHGTQVRPDGT